MCVSCRYRKGASSFDHLVSGGEQSQNTESYAQGIDIVVKELAFSGFLLNFAAPHNDRN